MASLVDLHSFLKLVSDTNRMRIVSCLDGQELTVKELGEVLSIGQSTLSSQLATMKEAALVQSRREGQYVYYRVNKTGLDGPLSGIFEEIRHLWPREEWYERDQRSLDRIMDKRHESSLSFFGSQKNQFGPSPGQTDHILSHGLMWSISGLTIVDLGCGNGRLSRAFADAGNKVFGVDLSKEQVEGARQLHKSVPSLQFLMGDMEQTTLSSSIADLVVISHSLHHAPSPGKVFQEAARLLKPRGRLLIFDIHQHNETWVKERFGDFWLGFSEDQLREWSRESELSVIHHKIVACDPDYPSIESVAFMAQKK